MFKTYFVRSCDAKLPLSMLCVVGLKNYPTPHPTMLWCPAPRSPEIPDDLSLTFQVVFTVCLVKVKG